METSGPLSIPSESNVEIPRAGRANVRAYTRLSAPAPTGAGLPRRIAGRIRVGYAYRIRAPMLQTPISLC